MPPAESRTASADPSGPDVTHDRLLSLLPLRVRSRRAIRLCCLGWGLAVFLLDLRTPLAVADDALYITVVLASLWLRKRRDTLVAAGLASAGILGAHLLAPADVRLLGVEVLNRGIALALVWLAVVLVLAINRALDQIAGLVGVRAHSTGRSRSGPGAGSACGGLVLVLLRTRHAAG